MGSHVGGVANLLELSQCTVQQAISTHPELERYVVAFACDLTGQAGKKKGLPGWQLWDNHKAKRKKWAKKKAQLVNFECWTKGDLTARLIDPTTKGLAEYWFHSPLFDLDWFDKQFQLVKRDLDERYHPEDHVEVGSSRLFQGLGRTPLFSQGLLSQFNDLPEISSLRHNLAELKVQPDESSTWLQSMPPLLVKNFA